MAQIEKEIFLHSHASIAKARKNLNYSPQFNLQKGLKEAVKWYWKNL